MKAGDLAGYGYQLLPDSLNPWISFIRLIAVKISFPILTFFRTSNAFYSCVVQPQVIRRKISIGAKNILPVLSLHPINSFFQGENSCTDMTVVICGKVHLHITMFADSWFPYNNYTYKAFFFTLNILVQICNLQRWADIRFGAKNFITISVTYFHRSCLH